MPVAPGEDIDASDIPVERYPIGRLQQATNQNVPDATLTALTWTTEAIDTDGQHDPVTNTSRITPNLAGYYRFDVCYYSEAAATPANMDVSVRKNGTGTIASGNRVVGATIANSVSGWTMLDMNGDTDYVEFLAFQDSAGAELTNVSSRFTSFCTWQYLRPL